MDDGEPEGDDDNNDQVPEGPVGGPNGQDYLGMNMNLTEPKNPLDQWPMSS